MEMNMRHTAHDDTQKPWGQQMTRILSNLSREDPGEDPLEPCVWFKQALGWGQLPFVSSEDFPFTSFISIYWNRPKQNGITSSSFIQQEK